MREIDFFFEYIIDFDARVIASVCNCVYPAEFPRDEIHL